MVLRSGGLQSAQMPREGTQSSKTWHHIYNSYTIILFSQMDQSLERNIR
jgi:hypothetical protein